MRKYVAGLFIAVFCLLGGQVHAQDMKSNIDVKMMPGVVFTDVTGGSINALITSKKLDFFVTPALDLGLGSRLLSDGQTGQDVTTHMGGGLCAFEKLVCVAYIYNFSDKVRRVNASIDLISIVAMSLK